MADSANVALAELLELAQWNPRQLVRAVNARLAGQGRGRLRLDPTAGYSWVRRGFCPRPPVPEVAALVLSGRLGRPVTATELWPECRGRDGSRLAAAGGLDGPLTMNALAGELGELGVIAVTPACRVAEATGADLLAAVSELGAAAGAAVGWADGDRVVPEQVDVIAAHVAALRRLDDRLGGGPLSLRYVAAELRTVVDLAEHARYDRVTGRRLLEAIADLSQLAGWLCFDAGRTGAAERFLLLSLGVARAAGAGDRAANVIGMLAYVSAFAGHGWHAVGLAEAAARECPRPGPVLRARLAGREATAAAAAGDLARFRRCSEEAAGLAARHEPGVGPPFLYYLTPQQLAAEAGQGLVVLAGQVTAGRGRLLGEAQELLGAAVAAMAAPGADGGAGFPRSALVHGSFAARAHLGRGDLEQAAAVVRGVAGLLGTVQSPRARNLLLGLRPVLARRSLSVAAREALEALDGASSAA